MSGGKPKKNPNFNFRKPERYLAISSKYHHSYIIDKIKKGCKATGIKHDSPKVGGVFSNSGYVNRPLQTAEINGEDILLFRNLNMVRINAADRNTWGSFKIQRINFVDQSVPCQGEILYKYEWKAPYLNNLKLVIDLRLSAQQIL